MFEGGIPLKLVLGAREMLHFPFVLMNRLNETEYAIFLYSTVSLFLKDISVFQII